MPGKQRSPNTWQSVDGLRPRAGGRSCAVTLTASRRWTCSWFRPSPFDCSMDCSYCNTVGAKSYGWESPRTQRLNGSPASSPRPTAGRQHRDTSSVTATPSTATFSFAAFRQWAFVTGRLRRDHHGKTDAERLIGSIRRECLDYVVVFGERHLRHLLGSYQRYYNEARTHLSLNKDAPISRTVETVGSIVAKPLLGGLHHQYLRI
jgi:hypothetical protein